MAETRKRDWPVAIRLSAEERAMLSAVAEHRGLTQSDVVRQCIRACYREEIDNAPPKRRR